MVSVTQKDVFIIKNYDRNGKISQSTSFTTSCEYYRVPLLYGKALGIRGVLDRTGVIVTVVGALQAAFKRGSFFWRPNRRQAAYTRTQTSRRYGIKTYRPFGGRV